MIVASWELSIHENPLPVCETTSPERGFAMTFAQGRGGRGSVTTYSRPSSENRP